VTDRPDWTPAVAPKTEHYRTAEGGYTVRALSEAARTAVEVPVSDLEYVASEMRSIRRPRRWLSVLASASVGVFVTALFAGFSGLIGGSTMPPTWRVGYFTGAGFACLLSVVLYAVDRGESGDPERCAQRALARMIAIEIVAPAEEVDRHAKWRKFNTWLWNQMPWS